MTVDGNPPSKSEIALGNLDTEVRYEEVLRMLGEQDVLPPETLKENDGTFTIKHTELAKEAYNVVLDTLMHRAENTEGWSNGRDPMDPRHRGETVAEAAGEELHEVAAEETERVMQKILSNVDDGVYVDQHSEFEVTEIQNDPLPPSAFR